MKEIYKKIIITIFATFIIFFFHEYMFTSFEEDICSYYVSDTPWAFKPLVLPLFIMHGIYNMMICHSFYCGWSECIIQMMPKETLIFDIILEFLYVFAIVNLVFYLYKKIKKGQIKQSQ